jgi:hypothetical protein
MNVDKNVIYGIGVMEAKRSKQFGRKSVKENEKEKKVKKYKMMM